MKSWVRYSVAVYLGLLLAGLAGGPPHATEAEGVHARLPDNRLAPPPRAWHKPDPKVEMKVRIKEQAPPSWLD